jgi:hypothetical protein
MVSRGGWISIAWAGLLACGCSEFKGQAQSTNDAHQGHSHTTAPDEAGPLKVVDKKPPRFVTDKTSYNFQKMDQGTIGQHTFEIRNEGVGELSLRIQQTTCGCTSVKLADVVWDPKDPAPKTIVTVPPGEKVQLEMNWNTAERVGDFRTSANLDTNDPKQPVAIFSVDGEIIPFLEVTQSQIRIDEVKNKEVSRASTHVYSKKYDDLQLTGFTATNSLVSAEFEPMDEAYLQSMKATSGVKINIVIQPGLPIGPFAAAVICKTNKEQRPEIRIDVVGHVAGDVLLTPYDKFDFGSVSVRDGKIILLFVKIVGETPVEVKIGSIRLYRPDRTGETTGTPVDSFLDVKLTEYTKGKNRWQLKAEVPAGSPAGEFRGGVELETTHPTAKTIKIPVRFEVTR